MLRIMSQCPVSGYLEVQHVQERVEGGVGVASPEHHRVQGPGGLPVLNMQGGWDTNCECDTVTLAACSSLATNGWNTGIKHIML